MDSKDLEKLGDDPDVKKEKKEEKKHKPKEYYEVKVETMLPATLTFRILADSAEQALELTKTIPPNNVKYTLKSKRDKSAKVYVSGTTLLKLVKSLL